MINILFQVLVCGIAVAAICRTIVYYDGPFQVFPRFRNSLLPKSDILLQTYDIKNYGELEEKFAEMVMDQQLSDSQFEMWKVYQIEHNPKFYLSLKGTLYSLLDCPFCLGPYISTLMALVSTGFGILVRDGFAIYYHDFLNLILVASGSYGLHFIISKRWGQFNEQGL